MSELKPKEDNLFLSILKKTYSTCLLLLSTVLIMGLIATRQTKLSQDFHPALAYCILWIAVLWLSMVEGSQASLVGLAPVRRELYMETHPYAYKCTSLCHKGDNLHRYLLGRQFMVVFLVFMIHLSGAFISGSSNIELWGLPTVLLDIFLTSGLGIILFTCMIGQINTQVNAGLYMLDYINHIFALFTVWTAFIVEFSGILHFTYVIQLLVAYISGKKIDTYENEWSLGKKIFFWLRVILSFGLLCGSLAVTIQGLLLDQTNMWEGLPRSASIVLFFVLLCITGLFEGMQIAFFAVAKLPEDDRGDSMFAKLTCELLFRGEGDNLPGFMIGRQLCVVTCFFVIARLTTLNLKDETIFGVSDSTQMFFNTGIPGALITTMLGSLVWQLVASGFPLWILSNPLTYVFLRLSLFLESLGLASGAWLLALLHKTISGFEKDELYIGTAEDRAKNSFEDNSLQLKRGPGYPVKLPGFIENAPESLRELIESDYSVLSYFKIILPGGKEEKNEDNKGDKDESFVNGETEV